MPRIPFDDLGSGPSSSSSNEMSYPIDLLHETATKIRANANIALQEHDQAWHAIQAYIDGSGPRPFNFWSPNQNLLDIELNVQPLDRIHDQRVQAFEHEIWALFGPDSSFSGNAADALAELVGNYLTAEQALGDYTSNSLSDLLAKAAANCDSTVTSMEPILASLQVQGFPGVAAAGAVLTQVKNVAQEDGGPPGPENPLWDFIVVGGIVIAGGAFLWEQEQQQIKVRELWQDIQRWQGSMRNLAQQTESMLPPDASEAKIFMPIASSLGLTIQQQETS